MTRFSLVVWYALFAAIATAVNLLVQRLVLGQEESATRYGLAIGAGTLVGLVLKFWLDKRWIFFDGCNGFMRNGRKFSLYGLMGLVTTPIFWIVETIFWWFWRTTTMREIGAIFGLAIGYLVKYHLDKRFVFSRTFADNSAERST